MNVLHVASFVGNIGDNANHQGMRRVLSQVIPGVHTYTEFEIRKCYRIYTGEDRWHFDNSFAQNANEHDLVIVGGGNFFEPWLSESISGTTIDLSDDVLDNIHVPILFYGIGFDTYKECSDECLLRFKVFLESLNKRKNVILTFRNDGSYKNLISAFGMKAPKVEVVPDGGFFFQPGGSCCLPLKVENEYWGINLASDMKDIRFNQTVGWNSFLQQYAELLSKKLESRTQLQLIFFPHIYSDLDAIYQLLSYLDDRFCRNRVQVAPYMYGWDGAENIFSLYEKCSLIMGMRFHTNVCAMGMGKAVIGLSSSPKIFDLYEELGLLKHVVKINQIGFETKLEALLLKMNSLPVTSETLSGHLKKELHISAVSCFEKVKALL